MKSKENIPYGRSNLIADIDLNALIVEDHSSLSLDEYNPPIGVESDSLIVCNVRSSSFDGDHDDIPGFNPVFCVYLNYAFASGS
nr:hypothetical protein Iba_chr15dCG8120 [Ipomoea batatas]